MLFRCSVCPCAFCEDHVPAERFEQDTSADLLELGFNCPAKAFFIICSLTCATYYKENVSHYKEPFPEKNVQGKKLEELTGEEVT